MIVSNKKNKTAFVARLHRWLRDCKRLQIVRGCKRKIEAVALHKASVLVGFEAFGQMRG